MAAIDDQKCFLIRMVHDVKTEEVFDQSIVRINHREVVNHAVERPARSD